MLCVSLMDQLTQHFYKLGLRVHSLLSGLALLWRFPRYVALNQVLSTWYGSVVRLRWTARLHSHLLPRADRLDLLVTACHHSLDFLQRLPFGLGHDVLDEEECDHAQHHEGGEHP